MALFRGIQEYIALNANNITLVFDSGNIVNNIVGNIFLYPPQGHPILYNYCSQNIVKIKQNHANQSFSWTSKIQIPKQSYKTITIINKYT